MNLAFEVREKEATISVTIEAPTHDELLAIIPYCPKISIMGTVVEFLVTFP